MHTQSHFRQATVTCKSLQLILNGIGSRTAGCKTTALKNCGKTTALIVSHGLPFFSHGTVHVHITNKDAQLLC